MISKEQLTGVVLAGGQSSRFGSNKAMAHMDGKTFLRRAVDLLKPLCAEVIISGFRPEYAEVGCRMIKDEYEICGPLAGIHAALETCTTEYALFLTCDMPLMEPIPLLYMLSKTPTPVVGWHLHEMGGGIFPLLVATALAANIDEALKKGKYSIRYSLCERADAQMLEIPNNWATYFININRKEDLRHILT